MQNSGNRDILLCESAVHTLDLLDVNRSQDTQAHNLFYAQSESVTANIQAWCTVVAGFRVIAGSTNGTQDNGMLGLIFVSMLPCTDVRRCKL